MTALSVTIANRDYDIACDDGQEGHLKQLAKLLDARIRTFGDPSSKIPESQLLILAALMLTDELQDTLRERDQLRSEILTSSQSFEQNKQIELENAVAATISDIADRIEAIAGQLERV